MRAHIADGDGGIRVIDVGTPSAPEEAGYFITPYPATEVAVFGNQIVAGLYDGGGDRPAGHAPSRRR